MRHISASILACNIMDLKQILPNLSCVDSIHYDVTDGHYSNEISFGSKLCQEIANNTDIPIFIHLMVSNPEKQIPLFAKCDVEAIAFHPITLECTIESLHYIKSANIRAGVAISNINELQIFRQVCDNVDHVIALTVIPGLSGQRMNTNMLNNISEIRNIISPDTQLFADGGINDKTIDICLQHGADSFIVGHYLFSGPITEKTNILRN